MAPVSACCLLLLLSLLLLFSLWPPNCCALLFYDRQTLLDIRSSVLSSGKADAECFLNEPHGSLPQTYRSVYYDGMSISHEKSAERNVENGLDPPPDRELICGLDAVSSLWIWLGGRCVARALFGVLRISPAAAFALSSLPAYLRSYSLKLLAMVFALDKKEWIMLIFVL